MLAKQEQGLGFSPQHYERKKVPWGICGRAVEISLTKAKIKKQWNLQFPHFDIIITLSNLIYYHFIKLKIWVQLFNYREINESVYFHGKAEKGESGEQTNMQGCRS